MPRLMTCSSGHQWESSSDKGAVTACPECGSATMTWKEVSPGLTQEWNRPADESAEMPRVPGHEVLELLGRGGMGVVYKARQTQLKRLVALKMILAGPLAGAGELQRFRQEAEAVARLQHRHVVRIYEVGDCEGRPFFSLEYVAGGSLAQRVAGTPQDAKQAARLVEMLARAVQAAHEAGIVHRDLKPANILLAGSDAEHGVSLSGLEGAAATWEPRIADFGLAKNVEGGAGQTHSGQILGTPSYMAPEQALGHASEVGPRADVYALGAILYELLTGRPPFRAATVLDTLEQVRSQEPVPPTRLQPKLALDAETICLKCLQKEPPGRYGTALELADDLRRFQEDRPIAARPVGQAERAWRWTRRNPRLAAAVALAVLFLVVGSAVSIFFAWQERTRAHYLTLETERANTKANEAAQSAQKARQSADLAASEKLAADAARDRANEQKLTARRHAYASAINLAHKAWESGLSVRALDLLKQQLPPPGEEDLRGFEWYFLWRLCQDQDYERRPHGTFLRGLAVAGNGKTFASVSYISYVQLGYRSYAQIWETATGKLLVTIPFREKLQVSAVALDREGQTLAAGFASGEVALFDAVTSKYLAKLSMHKNSVRGLAFSPDGKLLASSDVADKDKEGGEVHVWEVAKRKRLLVLDKFADSKAKLRNYGVNCLAFAPDSKRLATGGVDDGDWRLWDATTGKELLRPMHVPGYYQGIAFSPDGKQVATVSDDRLLRFWDSAAGEELQALQVRVGRPESVGYAPDGKQIAVATSHGVLLWDLATGQRHGLSVQQRIVHVAFTADGKSLLTGALGLIQLWKLSGADAAEPCGRWYTSTLGFPVGPERVAVGQFDRHVLLWDVKAKKHVGDFEGPESRRNEGPAFALGGKNRVAAGSDKGIYVWNLENGKQSKFPSPFKDDKAFHELHLAPDGMLLAATSSTGEVALLEADTGLEKGRWLVPAVRAATFSADGARFGLVAGKGEKVRVHVRDAASGVELANFSVPWDAQSLAMARDGKIAATAHGDGGVRFWDPASGRLLLSLTGHRGPVWHLDFSPDGRTLATAGEDTSVRLWQAATGQELLILHSHREAVKRVLFAPDSKALASGSGNDSSSWGGSAKYWRAAAPDEVAQRLLLDHPDETVNREFQVRWIDANKLRVKGNHAEAQQLLREVLPKVRHYAASFPRHLQPRRTLQQFLIELGTRELREKNDAQEIEYFRQAEPILTQLAAEFPEVASVFADLGLVRFQLGKMEAKQGNGRKAEKLLAEARGHFQHALALSPGWPPTPVNLRSNLILEVELREKRHDHAGLVELAKEHVAHDADKLMTFRDAARWCVKAMAAVDKAPDLSAPRRLELHTRYGDQALAYVRMAIDKGLARSVLAKEDYVRALHAREDMKKLLGKDDAVKNDPAEDAPAQLEK